MEAFNITCIAISMGLALKLTSVNPLLSEIPNLSWGVARPSGPTEIIDHWVGLQQLFETLDRALSNTMFNLLSLAAIIELPPPTVFTQRDFFLIEGGR